MQWPNVLGIVGFRVFPDAMGGQKYVANYYREMSKQIPLVLCTSYDNDDPKIKDVSFYRFLFNHWKAALNIFYVFRVVKIIRKHRIDIILIDHSYFGWLGVLLQLLTHKPFIIKSANLEYQRFKETKRPFWRIYKIYEKWVHGKAAHSFFITDEDREAAIQQFYTNPSLTSVLPCFLPSIQYTIAKNEARRLLIEKHSLSENTKLFYFNGTLDYAPNVKGLHLLINHIIPLLNKQHFLFRVIITGNRLKDPLRLLLADQPSIIFDGYVPNTALYHLGTDCFVCMLESSTGIKTKIVDALAFQQKIICTKAAASGFNDINYGAQLDIVSDTDWDGFVKKMTAIEIETVYVTPANFYQKHNVDRIINDSLLSLRHAAKLG